MIETLNGVFETVNYQISSSIKLYDNDEYENYPAHWHTTIEIIMPTQNGYTADCAGTSLSLKEGDILFIAPGCLHTLYAPPVGRRIIFQQDVNSIRFIKDIEDIITLISPAIVITPEEYPELHAEAQRLIIEIKDMYLANGKFMEIEIYAKYLKLLTLVGENYIAKAKQEIIDNSRPAEYMERFIGICDYITEHCTENLTLDEIADMSGFSKYYFTRLFKQYNNDSFYKYVNRKRIALAEEMLVDPSKTITDVAINCGFSSLSSFIRMFKIIKGCTPSEFKSMYKSFY